MGGKKKKGGDAEEPVVEAKPILVDKDLWVYLDFKLLNWKFMNFKAKCKESTYIFSIKKLLQERHGKLEDLRICFNSFTEGNEAKNDMLTLKEYGINGALRTPIIQDGKVIYDESSVPVIQVFYDFKPTGFDDPVLLFDNK